MIGTSFFRSNKQKCPKCGMFGEEVTDHDFDIETVNVCPGCRTQFNEYCILQEGRDVEFENH
jgi:uncharacterized CHY-type Zn-finger protein